MIANIPNLMFLCVLISIVLVRYWWNPRRARFQGGPKRYAAACFVDVVFSYVALLSAFGWIIDNSVKVEKNDKIWIIVVIMIGAMLLREVAKKFPVLGPLLVEFDNAAAINSPSKITQNTET
jgi:hypothetical protein